MKKAFSMMEIIVALIISASIAAYMISEKRKSDFLSSVSEFSNTLVSIIETGVLDPNIGYPSSANSECGGTGDYANITADKVRKCIGWENYGDDGDATLHGINLLGEYTNGEGCKISFDDDSGDSTIFYVFIDCSSLSYDNANPRYKKYLEEKVDYTLRSKFSTIWKETNRDADSLSTNNGDEQDGMLKLKFKK